MVAITMQTMAAEISRQRRLAQSISDDQAAISSGTRITTASQDPQAWVQISDIGRAQSQNGAWADNISYGTARAQKADANLQQLNDLFSHARELMISASTSTLDASGKAALVADLQSIKGSISDLLNEKDYQGTPVFDDTTSITVPVARGLSLDVVGTRQALSTGINVGGTPRTMDEILDEAITAVTSANPTDRENSLKSLDAGLNHVILNQTVQGIRADRLDKVKIQTQDNKLSLAERRTDLEDTDLTSTIAGLQAKLLSLEAAQSAFARINRQSLFDLIR
jgi:flagellar hook-associated protein 3 FlgL